MALRLLNSKSGLREISSIPRIQELIFHSYACELCDTECSFRSEDEMQNGALRGDWMVEKVRLYAPTVHQGGIVWRGLEGRICRPCLVFLTPRLTSRVARRAL
jgi:hypothetical protein